MYLEDIKPNEINYSYYMISFCEHSQKNQICTVRKYRVVARDYMEVMSENY